MGEKYGERIPSEKERRIKTVEVGGGRRWRREGKMFQTT
jgi:hypothetical protein